MTRLTACWTILFLLLPLRSAAAVTEIYLFENPQTNQWCAYRDHKVYYDAGGDANAEDFATLYYDGDHLTKVEEASQAESGDYFVSNNYSLDENGTPVKLERRTDTFHGQVTAIEIYSLAPGKVRKLSTDFLDLVSHKPVGQPESLWLNEDYPIRTSLKEFPFFPLIDNPAVQTAEKSCAPGK